MFYSDIGIGIVLFKHDLVVASCHYGECLEFVLKFEKEHQYSEPQVRFTSVFK